MFYFKTMPACKKSTFIKYILLNLYTVNFYNSCYNFYPKVKRSIIIVNLVQKSIMLIMQLMCVKKLCYFNKLSI